MILTKLIIENFGPFRGTYVFDLKPVDRTKPIILFGGKNGSGKTTLFEAIKLCLYGNTFNGYPLSSTEYEDYINKKIHRYEGLIIQPDYASITLEFKYSHLGNINTYKVKRFWKIKDESNKTKVSEYIEIYKNDKLLDDIEGYQWNHFIRSLIPQGLTDLYFFDGEKIQRLATEGLIENENTNINILKESLYTLFGLDVIERTKIDLAILKEKLIKSKSNSKSLENELKNLSVKGEEIKRKLELLRDERASRQNKVNYISGQIEKQEQLLSLEGGIYATNREKLNARKEILSNEIDRLEAEIKKLVEGLLPFTIVHEYCKRIKRHLLEDDIYKKKIMAIQMAHEKISKLQENIPSLVEKWFISNGDLDNNVAKKEIIIRITSWLLESIDKELINSIAYNNTLQINATENKNDQNEPIYNNYLSTYNKQQLLRWISELKPLSSHFYSLAKILDKLVYEKQEVEKALLHCPPEESINALLEDLNKLHTSLREENALLVKIDEDIKRLEYEYNNIERTVNKIMEQLKVIKATSTKELLIDKLQQILEEFSKRVSEEKLKALEENFLLTLTTLLHKNLCNKITIDPTNFTITLYKDNNKIPKENLSSGEKQVYAIALLWALTRCSNKPMPFIIDTPLARLDSEHRSNLVYNFFPNASYQVIILSTDTEIDKAYFDKLKPYISIAYQLVYNEGAVKVQKGYFWESEAENKDVIHQDIARW